MKKLYIALGILVVLAAAFFGYYQYLKSSLLADLDAVYIPAAEQMLTEQLGRECTITYDKAETDGFGLAVKDMVIAPKDAPDKATTISRLELEFDAWDLMMGKTNLDLKAKDITSKWEANSAEIDEFTIKRLDIKDANNYSFERLKLDDVEIEAGEPEIEKVKINSARFDMCQTSVQPDQKTYSLDLAKGEVVFEDKWTLAFNGFSTKSIYAGVLFPPPGSYFAHLKEISLAHEGQQFITASNFKALSEAQEGRVDSTMDWEKLVIKPIEIDGENPLKEPLESVGYEQIQVGMSAKASMVKEGDVFDMPEMIFSMPEAGQLGFSIRLLGFLAYLQEYQAKQMDQEKMEDHLAKQIKLTRFEIKYVDHSLIDRIAGLLAKESQGEAEGEGEGKGMDAAQMRAQWGMLAGLMAAQAATPGIRDLYKAVSVFLQDPKNISVSVEPDPPLTLEQAMEAGWPGVLTKLNLKAKANTE